MAHPPAYPVTNSAPAVPDPVDPERAAIEWSRWTELAHAAADARLREEMLALAEDEGARRWLTAIFGNSPHLTRLALRDPEIAASIATRGPDATFTEVRAALNSEDPRQSRTSLGARLRRAKRHAALTIAVADIAGLWPLERVTGALSAIAEDSLTLAVRHLLWEAAAAGRLELADPETIDRDCGLIVLGMGKLGALELNYSSDIDLIILFDPDKVHGSGRDSVQGLMARLTRDLVRLMEERTAEGYVFRTDLRLRPDPGSTPPAISVEAAETYYGSVGQNWERAALIKARPVAGDRAAGEAFLSGLSGFIWRKHLDFAAIRDIHSIKRQIDDRHGPAPESLAGHNIKLGHGGIREIEFFVQTQQLVWGGRIPSVRTRGTVETLARLVDVGRVEASAARELAQAYELLRRVEHRLQMIEDSQTHSLPSDGPGLRRLAIFLGYEDVGEFTAALAAQLETVRRHFAGLFPNEPTLSAHGNLVFTGAEPDPETLSTIERLGFREPARVFEAVSGWHHGRIRAARSARARELLTELVPMFLQMLGRTADPDFAFARFGEFLAGLPAGVQLFSLFQRNPDLFKLVAEIMGESPLLSARLARRPVLLDGVLTGAFFEPLPVGDAEALAWLAADLDLSLQRARAYEEVLDLTRRWAGDRQFQIGVQLMQGRIDGERAGRHFTLVTEAVIAALLPEVERDLARSYGRVPRSRFLVLGLGKLGSREMNILSDLDLTFLYDAPDPAAVSDGRRSLPATSYFARLGQRLINALSAPTADGTLFEVDMRLRPSGSAGPIASSLESFRRYHAEQAWTWERMALTRARVIAGDRQLAAEVDEAIRSTLCQQRDPVQLQQDIAAMRLRIEQAHPAPKPWDCKHRRGALIDLEFIVQYLQLRAAPDDPSVLCTGTICACERLARAGRLDSDDARSLVAALRFWQGVQQVLRVLLGRVEGEALAPELLDRALQRATGIADPLEARGVLEATAAKVRAYYAAMLEPAGEPVAGGQDLS